MFERIRDLAANQNQIFPFRSSLLKVTYPFSFQTWSHFLTGSNNYPALVINYCELSEQPAGHLRKIILLKFFLPINSLDGRAVF